MIRLPDAPPRPKFETLLPLIDVVFFLVIAFMMISHLTTTRPFAVTLPDSAQKRGADGQFTLYLSATGEIGFVGQSVLTGDAALAGLAQARADQCAIEDCVASAPVLLIAADSAAPAPALAALLPRLTVTGFDSVLLVTTGG